MNPCSSSILRNFENVVLTEALIPSCTMAFIIYKVFERNLDSESWNFSKVFLSAGNVTNHILLLEWRLR